MKERPLNLRQQKFVDEYLVDYKGRAAAVRAGYSEESYPMLLSNPRIMAAIEKAQKNHLRRLGLTQERVLEEYLKLAFSDIMNFVNVRTERVLVGHTKDGAPISQIKNTVTFKENFESLPDNVLAAISEISESPSAGVRIKLHDKLKALDSLAKHLGLFVNRVEVTGKGGGPIQYDLTKLSIEELSALEALLSKSTSS